jgi:hypothetical protein
MSLAFELMPRPDWAATTTVAVPSGLSLDVGAFARDMFDVRSLSIWGKALFAGREVVAKLMGIPPGRPEMLAVREVRDGEALLDTDDRHLHFVAGVRIENGLAHVTTAVCLKGLRGRLYFLPVRLLHDQVTRTMMQRALASAVAASAVGPEAPGSVAALPAAGPSRCRRW